MNNYLLKIVCAAINFQKKKFGQKVLTEENRKRVLRPTVRSKDKI